MHQTAIRQEIIDRVMARRGRLHLFDRLDPRQTAVVVIDMQNTFCQPGAPAEVPLSRSIVDPINRLNAGVRAAGGACDLVHPCQHGRPGRGQRLAVLL